MNFKKLIALICACAVFSAQTSAFTPFLPEDIEKQEQESTSESTETDNQKSEEATDGEPEETAKDETSGETSEESSDENSGEESEKVPASQKPIYNPSSVYYKLFRQILDTYVENHLYDITHEDVLYKFFEDFLTDNPMYFKYFTNYMLGTMDPYSSYHEADDGFLDGDNVQKGFGITLGTNESGKAIVTGVIDGTSAMAAGIQKDDEFVSVMGFKVDDLPLDAVTTILAGMSHFVPEGENPDEAEYTFEFRRNGEIVPITMRKGSMALGSIDSYVENHNNNEIGVITLTTFLGANTDTIFVDTVKDFYEKGIKHLTIDLRDNGGGSLDYALTMAECFVPNGEILCYYKDKTLEEPRAVYSTTDSYSFESIAILINENTASAAELFSHILHLKGIAKLIGTPSYGKGIGQTIYTLLSGDYITITTYEMLDENLENYDGTGLIPDLKIDETEMCYELPSLMWFNHENYKEIKEGEYSDPAKALEDRLVIAGLLFEEHSDGIFDDTTKRAVFALQMYMGMKNPTGVLDDETVTQITKLINAYKTYTYHTDSPYEVSLYMHRSFSQGKRRLAEIEEIAKTEKEKIEARNKALEQAKKPAREEESEKANSEAEPSAEAENDSSAENTADSETKE